MGRNTDRLGVFLAVVIQLAIDSKEIYQKRWRSSRSLRFISVLMHARLFGIPLEFVNLVIALFAYACSYASVFWRVSKPFSFFFSAHLLVHVITVIWSYLGFSVLYRIQETSYASVRPVGLGQLRSYKAFQFLFYLSSTPRFFFPRWLITVP